MDDHCILLDSLALQLLKSLIKIIAAHLASAEAGTLANIHRESFFL